MLKVCTPIYRNDSGGRPSRLALMPLGAGICERCARDRSPRGPRRREAARFTRARRAGAPARAPHFAHNQMKAWTVSFGLNNGGPVTGPTLARPNAHATLLGMRDCTLAAALPLTEL
jgi:hypothetical protein